MKLLIGPPFDDWRLTSGKVVEHYRGIGNELCGAFVVPYEGRALAVIASAGDGWDHVSVSLPMRCPTWEEMRFVKVIFFKPDEWCYELHPPEMQNISVHPYCLHIWRPQAGAIPLPPAYMVG